MTKPQPVITGLALAREMVRADRDIEYLRQGWEWDRVAQLETYREWLADWRFDWTRGNQRDLGACPACGRVYMRKGCAQICPGCDHTLAAA